MSDRHEDVNLDALETSSLAAVEDMIFELFRVRDNEASVSKMLKVLRSYGFRDTDPRLKPMMDRLREKSSDEYSHEHFVLDKESFDECISESLVLVTQVLRNNLAIPNWHDFCGHITEIFNEIKEVRGGLNAQYIPQLARVDPNYWAVSVCTVDGQRESWGDARTPFCFQSTCKAFNYAIVATERGSDYVHKYVGQEPSGRLFNEICLDNLSRPHNPMVNAGAIATTSLIKGKWGMADRYDYMFNQYMRLAGGEMISFNNAVFLSERDTADRNFALAYFMKEHGCFPDDTRQVRDILDFYFQLCSLECNCESLAVMGATLANGGICPLTGDKVVDNRACRDVLSLMYSCGMYDYSGQFAFHVGLPAKSGVSGALLVVIPNLMSIALWSPPLDELGNSVRGVEFCKRLVARFNFHNYDSLTHSESRKIDPRKRTIEAASEDVVVLLFASKAGDLGAVRRFYMQGSNLEMADYDGRTALHIAASEGHAKLVRFLITVGKVDPSPKDRWQRTPLDDAIEFEKKECEMVLRNIINKSPDLGYRSGDSP